MEQILTPSQRKILDAALDLFKSKGYDNVTIPDIAKAAGCSASTFYYQFKSKDVMLNFLVHREVALNATITAEMLTASSPFEKLWLLHSSYAKLAEEMGPDLYSRILNNRVSQQISYDGDENYIYTVELAEAFIAQAQKLGEIRNTSSSLALANAVTRLLTGISSFWCAEKGKFDIYTFMRKDIEAFYDVRPDLRMLTD